jgi:hypothetical protein
VPFFFREMNYSFKQAKEFFHWLQIANSINDLGFPSSVIDGETGAGEIELEVSGVSKYCQRCGGFSSTGITVD